MAILQIDHQTAPATPPSGVSKLFIDSTSKKLTQTDDAGARHGSPLSKNNSTASLAITANTDTYITNSGIIIPSFGMEVGQCYRWTLTATKTAAGTAAAVWQIRTGTNQTTADTSRLTLTATTAQTAAVSSGIITVSCLVRTVSASGVIVAGVGVQTNNAGLGSGISGISSTFDNQTLGGNYVGLSVNTGAAAAWTVESCFAELIA